MSTENPFSAPTADSASRQSDDLVANPNSLGEIGKRTFLAWEKLRFVYVLILGAESLLLGASKLMSLEFWMLAIGGGLVSNACFFLGPIAETYLTWLGFRATWLRGLLFILGTMFTAVAAAIAIIALQEFPGPN